MSLEGLDATEVNEAYSSALGEGGGWFLLKYTTRAEVGLLARGSGGLLEAKEAIDHYDEQSPLYGFVHYRRRKVVLKYIPEATSRLLQARMIIHFQAVTEKLTPHDTIFAFTTSSELDDTTLSSACSLHTASASIKSSNDSLHQRGLAGIAEHIWENQGPTTGHQDIGGLVEQSEVARSVTTQREQPKEIINSQRDTELPFSNKNVSPSPSSRTISNVDKALPPTPIDFRQDQEIPKNTLAYAEYESRSSFDGRLSSQSSRPTTRELHNYSSLKPKVKLGPRPSPDTNGRPNTADPSPRTAETRPVSTLPAGLRMPARKAVPQRPKSPQSNGPVHSMVDSSASNLPAVPMLSFNSTKRPTSGIVGGVTLCLEDTEPKSPIMTPEKRRLMKALQLRQKQIAARSLKEVLIEPVSTVSNNDLIGTFEQNEATAKRSTEFSGTDGDLDNVHVNIRNFEKDALVNLDASPTSVTEPSDGISTQASSVCDEIVREHSDQKADSKPTSAQRTEIDRNENISPELAIIKMEESYKEEAATVVQEEHVDDLHLDPPIIPSQSVNEIPTEAEENCELKLCSRGIEIIFTGHQDQAVSITYSEEPPVNENYTETATEEPRSPQGSIRPIIEQIKAPIQEPVGTQSDVSESESPQKPVSSSSKPSIGANDTISPHDVPLPAISEAEEISLSPLRASFGEKNDSQPLAQRSAERPVPRSHSISHCHEEDDNLIGTRPSTADTVGDRVERPPRRNGVVHPIKRVSENSDDHFLSDDSFMEELKCAIVQEAKPISVSKSPITPVFPRTASDQGSDKGRTARSVSSPLSQLTREDPLIQVSEYRTPLSSRSISVSHPKHVESQQASIPLPKKVGVSSGISQRIKALEKLSSRPPSPSSQAPPPISSPGVSPPIISLRKSSLQTKPGSTDSADYSSIQGRQALPYLSPSSSPEGDFSKYGEQSLNIEKTIKQGKSRPDSISVTARIVRNGRNHVPDVPLNPSEPYPVDLYQSPLTVDHQSPDKDSQSAPLRPPNPRYAFNRSHSSSSTERKGEPTKATRRDSLASKRSAESRRGSDDANLSRPISETSGAGINSLDGFREEKKESKKGRLLKRMSNISSTSRRNLVQALSPTVKEEPIVEHREPRFESSFAIVDFGDVNIQFPDTLLWKRREMAIDDRGILVLSPSKADNNSKVHTKRFPLSEFHPPYVPDQDRQELPNSVILDFKDGSTLQCACENLAGQAQVFHALKQAHHLHNTQQ